MLSNAHVLHRIPQHNTSILMIGGGGQAPESHTIDLFNRFIKAAGGVDALIIVLTIATSSPERQRKNTCGLLEQLGATRLAAPLIRTRDEANDPANAALIREARGIYLTGGDQSRYPAILNDTACGDALRDALHTNAVCIGGTSAGAHVMGHVMIAGSYDWIMQKRGQVILRDGLGLLSDGIVTDSHFSQRRRLPRLLSALQAFPHLLGIGLDEDTGLLVNADGVGEVVGAGLVYFFNYNVTHNGGRVEQWGLGEGSTFDLIRRTPSDDRQTVVFATHSRP